jgi:hypothetical protein
MLKAPIVRVVCLVATAAVAPSCARPVLKSPEEAPRGGASAPLHELWQSPSNLGMRNLFWGPGQASRAPSTAVEYKVLRRDESGFSAGYDVEGPDGRHWDIKLGREAQPEIVLSRILWALGYHQPETYYVTNWRLAGEWKDEGTPARFRLQSDHETDGEWAWRENPFQTVQPLQGLVAINVLLGNWDFKTSNNRIYRRLDGQPPQRRFVVQDLGASLGKPRVFPIPVGSRNDIDDFEETQLVKSANGDKVVLDYRGLRSEILEEMQAADVIWGCTLLNRLSDAQLSDAFRAAGYDAAMTGRFIAKIRAKIAEGLALRQVAAAGGSR